MGDYIDKGPHAKPTLEFVMALQTTFPHYVTALLGNHELNLLNDRTQSERGSTRYFDYAFAVAHPMQYLAWARSDDTAVEEDAKRALNAIHDVLERVYSHDAHARFTMTPDGDRSIVEQVQPAELKPLVSRELRRWQAAYLWGVRSRSAIGQWLQQRPLAAVLAGTIFTHGGVPVEVATQMMPKLDVPLDSIEAIEALNAAWRNVTHVVTQADATDAEVSAAEASALSASPLFHAASELVEYRGLHDPRQGCARVAEVLNIFNSRAEARGGVRFERIAVGHTPANTVRLRCGGALVALDSALGRDFRATGNLYCDSRAEASGVHVPQCVRSAAVKCEGQIVRLDLELGELSHSEHRGSETPAWKVHVVESEEKAGVAAEEEEEEEAKLEL